jgi:hypothetical protein
VLARIGLPFILVGLSLASLSPPLRAEKRWPDERTAGPFVCHADFPLAAHLNLLREMAHLQEDLQRQLGVEPPREPIHMFLFDRKKTYQDYVQQYFPSVPFRQALFIKERGPGMVFAFRSSDFEVDLRHESTHALLHAALPMVPLWLDEGLAEYFEVRAEHRAAKHPHLGKLRWTARFGNLTEIQQLEKIESLDQMGQGEYRSAWAWVHFMLHGSTAARHELMAYLGDIQAHSPPGMLSHRLQRRVPDLDRRVAEHFRDWK